MAQLMNRAIALLTAFALLPGLSACASSEGAYPSLAKRDAERMIGRADPADSEPVLAPVPPAADLDARLAQLVADARDAHNQFTQLRPGAERIIGSASGSARLSDGWIGAQVALAGLDAARSKTYISLAELDTLYVTERIEYPDSITPSAQIIANARDEVQGLATQEDNVLTSLRSRVGS